MKSQDGKTQDWPALVEQARRQVITTMETRLGITGLREKIIWEEVNTPLTWKEKFNLAHGSILGITHDFFNVLSFRPQSRHPSIKNAYFVGASAHPGTGVSVFNPSHIAMSLPSGQRKELTNRSQSPLPAHDSVLKQYSQTSISPFHQITLPKLHSPPEPLHPTSIDLNRNQFDMSQRTSSVPLPRISSGCW